jgi:hypothetical protein
MVASNKLFIGCAASASSGANSFFDGSIANFRIYNKVLNADQIKELYDYQKDYFLGSKSQVTMYKGHLGVGVTEPSGQLELAGDERIQEYPPGPMSGYETLIPGHGVFCQSSVSSISYMSDSEYIVYPFSSVMTGLAYQSLYVHYVLPPAGTSLLMMWYGSGTGVGGTATGATYAGSITDLNLFPGAVEVWMQKTVNSGGGGVWQAIGYKNPADGTYTGPLDDGPFNKNDALTDYWESAASTYTSTSGGSPAVSTSGSTRLASNTPYGSWVTLKLPYEICLKSYEFTGAGTKSPKEGQIWGTTDGTTWSHVHTFTGGVTDVKNNETVSGNTNYYSEYAFITTKITGADTVTRIVEIRYFGTPGPTTLDKGSLTLGRSLDVPRISRYDVDTETPRPEKLVVDFDTTVNSSLTDISGNGNHGTYMTNTAGPVSYSLADKAFDCTAGNGSIYTGTLTPNIGSDPICSMSAWFKTTNADTTDVQSIMHLGDISARTLINIQVRQNRLAVGMCRNTNHANDEGVATGQIIESNRWYHVVGVKSGTGALTSSNIIFKIYLDGEEVGTPSLGSGGTAQVNIPSTARKLLVGGSSTSGGDPITGFISNPKLYNVALEPSEVQKLYRLGRTGRSMVISDTAVGIGKVPEAQLDVRGIIKGQSPAVFSAKANAAMTATAATAIALFGTVVTDTAGGWDSVNHRYYAKVPGFYIVNASQFTIVTTNAYVVIRIEKNGVAHSSTTGFAGPNGYPNTSLMALVYLSVGDYVRCRIGTDTNRTTASGHRLDIVHVGM